MTRTRIAIDKNELVTVINQCEALQSYPTRGKLFEAVAKSYTEIYKVSVSPAFVYLKTKEWAIPMTTPLGKKGRAAGCPHPVLSGPRQSRADKLSNDSVKLEALTSLGKIIPERFLPVFKKLKAGSLTAAIKLKCLDCSDYQSIEVKNCECRECSLWVIRPYQKG